MLEGEFRGTSNAPFVEARVWLPRLHLQELVWFLVDTGSEGTLLMPRDSTNLDFGRLGEPSTSQGIGGAAQGFSEEAILTFEDRAHAFSYLLSVQIAAPDAH